MAVLLTDLHFPIDSPTTVYFDNKSAIYLAHNPTFHEFTKRIEIDCHMVREKIQQQILHPLPVPASSQLADVLTKPLPFCYDTKRVTSTFRIFTPTQEDSRIR